MRGEGECVGTPTGTTQGGGCGAHGQVATLRFLHGGLRGDAGTKAAWKCGCFVSRTEYGPKKTRNFAYVVKWAKGSCKKKEKTIDRIQTAAPHLTTGSARY